MKNSDLYPLPLERLAEIETASGIKYATNLIEIEGVVSQQGQSGSSEGNVFDVHFFVFCAWRLVGQAINKNNLTLLRAVPLGAEFSAELSELSIHRFCVLLSECKTRALIWRRSDLPADNSQLADIAETLAAPVPIVGTCKVGQFTLNRALNWIEGTIQWNGGDVSLYIESAKVDDVDAGLAVAETLLEDQVHWSAKSNEIIVAELLDAYNDSWRVDDGPDMTAGEFVSRITLKHLSVHGTDKFYWHCNHGDLFGDHTIELTGNLKDGFTEAGLVG